MGLPNIDIDINGPKIGGVLDIHGPKFGLPNIDIDINGPKIGGDLDIHGPKFRSAKKDYNEPLNLRLILAGGVNDPIILNKKVTIEKKRRNNKNSNLPRYNTYNNINRHTIGLPNV